MSYLDPERASIGLKLNFITQLIYLWAITTVKISIALFLLRIAPSKTYKRFLWGTIAFLLVYTTGSFFAIIFSCRPIHLLWYPTIKAVCFTPMILRSLHYTNSCEYCSSQQLLAKAMS